jgi:hypothetical protein
MIVDRIAALHQWLVGVIVIEVVVGIVLVIVIVVIVMARGGTGGFRRREKGEGLFGEAWLGM